MINLVKTEETPNEVSNEVPNEVPNTLQSLLARLGRFASSQDKKFPTSRARYYTVKVEITNHNVITVSAYVEGFGVHTGKTIEECIDLMKATNAIKSKHTEDYKEVLL